MNLSVDADEDGDSAGGSASLPAAAVDHQVDVLLSNWNKAADMLFSIHPMDGSLLVWNVDWLDEYQPGMFRQAQVSRCINHLNYILPVALVIYRECEHTVNSFYVSRFPSCHEFLLPSPPGTPTHSVAAL